jgi:hypothetical protein
MGEFKVGDVVRLTKLVGFDATNGLVVGDLLRIAEAEYPTWYAAVDSRGYAYGLHHSQLELVSAAATPYCIGPLEIVSLAGLMAWLPEESEHLLLEVEAGLLDALKSLEPTCECGAEKCGASNHSSWCPLYG